MKIKSYTGKILWQILAIYYLFLYILFVLFSITSNLSLLSKCIPILLISGILIFARRLAINIKSQYFILHLFVFPFLYFSIVIGLAVFPYNVLLTSSVLVIIYLVFLLLPFFLSNITGWINMKIGLPPKKRTLG
jgi:hypothetical protein